MAAAAPSDLTAERAPPCAWRPQRGPQKALIDCPVPEVLFGGARGGGKTDGFLGKWALKSQKYRRGFNAVFFRQAMPQQDDLIDRAREIYEPIGGKWQEGKKMFLMPGGGRIRFHRWKPFLMPINIRAAISPMRRWRRRATIRPRRRSIDSSGASARASACRCSSCSRPIPAVRGITGSSSGISTRPPGA